MVVMKFFGFECVFCFELSFVMFGDVMFRYDVSFVDGRWVVVGMVGSLR